MLVYSTVMKSKRNISYSMKLLIWCGVVFVLWIIFLISFFTIIYFWRNGLCSQFSTFWGLNLGMFGDYFGALNTLFAGLAFAGLIVTISQQSQDLKATREEIRLASEQYAMQNLSASLFSYLDYMRQSLPRNHIVLRSNIFSEIETLAKLSDEISSNTDLAHNPEHIIKICICANKIRAGLKEYSTMRRVFNSWCDRCSFEMAKLQKSDKERENMLKIELWKMLSQHDRRILFLQNAFYLEGDKQQWKKHEQLVANTKCIKKYAKIFNKNSYNLLLLLLNPEGPPPDYALTEETVSHIVKSVYVNNQCSYKIPE